MTRYSVRPAKANDIDAVYELIAKQNTADYGEPMISRAHFHTNWQTFDLLNDTCLAYAHGELAGYAQILDNDEPTIYLAERTNVRLGYQLLKILEEKATLRKTKKFVARISERNQPLMQLFASNGYSSNLAFQIMELVMSAPPPPPQWAEGIALRTFLPGMDDNATYQADEEASQDKGYHSPLDFEGWAQRTGLYTERFDPGLWFLAFDRNEVVGLALNIYDLASDTGWVDHLGVRRLWRRQGIGKALLLHTFGEFYKRGVRTIKLSVDSKSLTNAQKLYEQVGLKTIQQYHIYKKELA